MIRAFLPFSYFPGVWPMDCLTRMLLHLEQIPGAFAYHSFLRQKRARLHRGMSPGFFDLHNEFDRMCGQKTGFCLHYDSRKKKWEFYDEDAV